MAKVYIETSMVGYLVARRSRDLIVAVWQQLPNDWWDKEREKSEVFDMGIDVAFAQTFFSSTKLHEENTKENPEAVCLSSCPFVCLRG